MKDIDVILKKSKLNSEEKKFLLTKIKNHFNRKSINCGIAPHFGIQRTSLIGKGVELDMSFFTKAPNTEIMLVKKNNGKIVPWTKIWWEPNAPITTRTPDWLIKSAYRTFCINGVSPKDILRQRKNILRNLYNTFHNNKFVILSKKGIKRKFIWHCTKTYSTFPTDFRVDGWKMYLMPNGKKVNGLKILYHHFFIPNFKEDEYTILHTCNTEDELMEYLKDATNLKSMLQKMEVEKTKR